MNNYYDYIIIGSGLAGLYSAYLIKKHNPSKTLLILDKEKKEWIGGRTGNETFFGNEIVTGNLTNDNANIFMDNGEVSEYNLVRKVN